jgi:hypothetical protein
MGKKENFYGIYLFYQLFMVYITVLARSIPTRESRLPPAHRPSLEPISTTRLAA